MGENYLQLHRNTNPKAVHFEISNLSEHIIASRYPDLNDIYRAAADFESLDVGNICVTSGIDGAIRDVIMSHCQPGDYISFLTPCYMMYKVYAEAFNLRVHEIRCDSTLQYNVESMLSTLTPTPKIFFLANPQSPVPWTPQLDFVEALAKHLHETHSILFIDEAYFYFGAPTLKSLIDRFPNVLVARSFSKAFSLPSIRVGYVMGRTTIIENISKRRLAYETNSVSALFAIDALKNFNRSIKYAIDVQQSRPKLVDFLVGYGAFVLSGDINSIVFSFREIGSKELTTALEAQGILIRTLPSPFDCFCSATLGDTSETLRLMEALTSIILRGHSITTN